MKICNKCNEEKSLTEFYKYWSKNGNKYYIDTECKDCRRFEKRLYIQRKDIKKRRLIYQREYRDSVKGKLCDKKYSLSDRYKISQKKYRMSEKCKNNKKQYEIKRRKNDINFRILCRLRTRLRIALKNKSKHNSTLELLGCSIKRLKQHLGNLFTENMTWGKVINGKIHIDHIKPCALFDLSKESEQKECFHYSNLQPLWAIENLRKNKYYEVQE